MLPTPQCTAEASQDVGSYPVDELGACGRRGGVELVIKIIVHMAYIRCWGAQSDSSNNIPLFLLMDVSLYGIEIKNLPIIIIIWSLLFRNLTCLLYFVLIPLFLYF